MRSVCHVLFFLQCCCQSFRIVTLAINIVQGKRITSNITTFVLSSLKAAVISVRQSLTRAPLQVFLRTSQDLLARVVKFIITVALQCQQNTTKISNKASARCSYLRGLNRCVCCTRWHLITFRVELEMVNKCFHRLLQKSIKIKAEIFHVFFLK